MNGLGTKGKYYGNILIQNLEIVKEVTKMRKAKIVNC
jgi:hypothetical protein